MTDVLSGFILIFENWRILFGLIVIQFAIGVLLLRFLRNLGSSDVELLFPLSLLAGILLPVLLFTVLAYAKIRPDPTVGYVLTLMALVVLFVERKLFFASLKSTKWLVLFFFVLLVLRMSFVHGLLVPPYADSFQHTMIVKDLISPDLSQRAFFQASFDIGRYYHLGFHALAAWLSVGAAASPEKTILVLGQYFQVLGVFSFYPFVRQITGKSTAALGILFILGLFSSMPGYASNWGKYPAIASLTGLGFCAGYWLWLSKQTENKNIWPWILFGLGCLATGALHTRMLFVFPINFLLFTGVPKVRVNIPTDEKTIWVLIISAFFFLRILFLYSELPLLLYGFLAIVSFLALYHRFQIAIGAVLFILLVSLLGFFQLPQDWNGSERLGYIVDQPYQKIVFSWPLALIVWLGFDAILSFINVKWIKFAEISLVFSLAIFGVAYNFIFPSQPSNCCIFLDDDDLFMMKWMEENISETDLVAIAATGSPGNFLASDGGVWLEYMTGISTRKIDHQTDFLLMMSELCDADIQYFYVDGLENSFDEYGLFEAQALYLIGMGNVKIYAAPCDG